MNQIVAAVVSSSTSLPAAYDQSYAKKAYARYDLRGKCEMSQFPKWCQFLARRW